jgi:hypothetical protein
MPLFRPIALVRRRGGTAHHWIFDLDIDSDGDIGVGVGIGIEIDSDPDPTPIIIPAASGTRLSCIEKMSKPQGWAVPTLQPACELHWVEF